MIDYEPLGCCGHVSLWVPGSNPNEKLNWSGFSCNAVQMDFLCLSVNDRIKLAKCKVGN
jgi:hypothetical protein